MRKRVPRKKRPRRLGAPDREGSLSERYLTTREVEYGRKKNPTNHLHPVGGGLLKIKEVCETEQNTNTRDL
jgi:hypothetical protein